MLSPIGLKTHIWSNTFKSALLLAGFPVLLIGLAYGGVLLSMGLGGRPTNETLQNSLMAALAVMPAVAPIALGLALAWYGVAFFAHQGIIDLATGARKIDRHDAPDLYNMVENLCLSRGVRTPAIRVIDSPALNAFASGVRDGQYSITFTTGLLQTLDREEVEAVAAHELTHILNRDVRLLIIAMVFVGIISFVGEMVLNSMRFGMFSRRGGSDRKGGGGGALIVIAIVIAIVAYGLAILIRFALSRKREYLADAGSVELTKNPDAMISALRKISGQAAMPIPREVAAMCIENKASVMELFATHPPIERRIAVLEQYAGGHTRASGPAFWSAPNTEPGPWEEPAQPGPWEA